MPLLQPDLGDDEICNCANVGAVDDRHRRSGYLTIADYGMDRIVFGRDQRRIGTDPPDFQLRMITMLEALDENEINIAEVLQQFG